MSRFNFSSIAFLPLVLVIGAIGLASPAQAAPTHRIFVSNERDHTVSVIDASSLQVIDTIQVGQRPRGLGLAPDGSELYVAISEEDRITVIDPVSLKVLRSFSAGSDPEAFAVHPNGNIYISNEDNAKASVYDPATGQQLAEIPVGLEPEGVAVSPDGSQVLVTSESSNLVHVISVPEHQIEANVLVGARPRAATYSKDGLLAYVSSEISGEIQKVDMRSFEVVHSVFLEGDGAKPKDVLLSRDEQVLYVAGGRANKIFFLDAGELRIQGQAATGKRVWGLALSADGGRLFTTDGVSGTVTVIDTAAQRPIETIKVGAFPWGIVIDD